MFKSAYPNLDREMQQKSISLRSLIEKTNIKYSTANIKLKQGKHLSIEEAFEIKDALESKQDIRILFAKG